MTLNDAIDVGLVASIGSPPTSRAWAIFLGLVFAVIAISLLVASWTRWGQSKPLAKCVGIALLAHIWLLLYAYGTRIVSPGYGPGANGGIASESFEPSIVAWEGPTSGSVDDQDPASWAPETSPPSEDGAESDPPSPPSLIAQPWESPIPAPAIEQNDAPKLPPVPLAALVIAQSDSIALDSILNDFPTQHTESELLSMANLPIDPNLPITNGLSNASPPATAVTKPRRTVQQIEAIPVAYRMRLSPNRMQFAANQGGDANTETAVENALAWLARNQSEDGAWIAANHGAGSEPRGAAAASEGKYRAHAGRRADTAMTGLALLAFLGAGHTHQDGPYAETVQRGIRYLASQQFPSGDLSGRSQIGQDPTVRYARMYSHGMASLALAEAYAMTNDPNLLPHVRLSVSYTHSAMNPRTGGWRYDFASDDPGDTSQFGWQAMVLNSSSRSGAVPIPGTTRLALQRFLDSVSTGRAGGLAVYRNVAPSSPAPVAAATPSMTAEAMALRCMLDMPITLAAETEARELILSQLPGQGEENFYYWYYAALAMYQLRGQSHHSHSPSHALLAEKGWERFNDAMKRQLCGTQIVAGENAGSWDPNCVWGSYGGRVYTTALGCMCLEVYYRYLPLYQQTAATASLESPPRR